MNRCIFTLCLGISIAAVAVEQTSGNDWPGFGGPQGDFRSPFDSDFAEVPVTPRLLWRKTIGPGLSGLVVSDDLVYACYADQQASQREVVVALDRFNGDMVWEQAYAAPPAEQQEAFGGRAPSPQATPLVIGNRLVTIGFSGIMHAFDLRTGRIAWTRNLVKDFSSIPVQFGFSSSPIEVEDRLVVFAGGKDGGLLCLDLNDGTKVWNVACEEASYATPVILEVEATRQIVFVTRNEIVGVDAQGGARLWQYSLPKAGLTNVPTPLVTSDGGLIVSGQGIGGTAKLKIHLDGETWMVEESWFNDFEFFYCNWVSDHERVIGCEGDLLIAFDSQTGEQLGRWRGFRDANVGLHHDRLIVMNGDGILSTLRVDENALIIETRHRLWNQRVWTPPALAGRHLFSRSGNEVSCIDLHGGDSGELLAIESTSRPRLVIAGGKQESIDAVEQITKAFEERGVEAATKTYAKLRQACELTVLDHLDLAEMAVQQGLNDMAKQVAADAITDFSGSDSLASIQRLFAELNRKPSLEIKRGSNGLDYIELAIRNNTKSELEVDVQGPAKHPFSYGISLQPGKVRVEEWPVGTKLIRTRSSVRERVLLEIAIKDAGQTIDLNPTRSPSRMNQTLKAPPQDES